ncbi:MAG: 50S ribosomal protein L6 [Rhodanobacteraceae bacterium]|nr:MAG: 50S ribosomal protein L6 [Rhodanobacteraceae bacterium]
MSRVAKKPIALPKGVEVQLGKDEITVKGPKGTLKMHAIAGVEIGNKDGHITCGDGTAETRFAGTTRALLANMVQGVSKGYERKLELVGVGFRAAIQGKNLNLALGFSHPVVFPAPVGITLETPSATEILVKGADKQQVGETAAKIRAFRPPEPYKGKGVRYAGEHITLKEAKKA